MSGLALLLLALQSLNADSLRVLAATVPDTVLVEEIRARPLLVRDAVAEALRRWVREPEREREPALRSAQRLAEGYALAWRDSFLLREVSRFAGWPAPARETRLRIDSLRRAGNAAYATDGPRTALSIWRRALSAAVGIGDTTAIAALLGNIGAAHLALGRTDSAESRLRRAEALAAAGGDLRVQANAIRALAGLSQDRGDLAAAYRAYERAFRLSERIGDTRGRAADYNNLGRLAQEGGDLDAARRYFEKALALNREDGRDEVAALNLVNLAGLASLAGEFAEAEGRYREALDIWRLRGHRADAASALHGLGQLEIRRGDYVAAQVALREALSIYQETGLLTERLAVLRSLAGSLSAAGDPQAALDMVQQAERIADSARAPPFARAGLALLRADLAVELNDLPEAEQLYRQAAGLYREARAPSSEAEAQQGLARLLLDRQDLAGAEELLQAAFRAQRSAGYRRSAALTLVQLGKLSAQRGDTVSARRRLARAEADLHQLGDPVATAEVLGERAALEASVGPPAVAGDLYQAALDRLGDRLAPDVAWRLHAGLGGVWQARGSLDRAAREFRAAVAALEQPARSLTSAELRSGFLADKWAVYSDLARVEHALGHPGTAFLFSEKLRAREMLELLGRGRIAAPATIPADLVIREQDLRHRMTELNRRSLEATSGPLRGLDLSRTKRSAREALLQAQRAYSDLLTEVRERSPRHAALVAGEPIGWREVARRLGRHEALLEYLLGDAGSLALVVTADTIAAVDLGVGRRELVQLIEFVRAVLEPGPAGSRDSLWQAPLRRLHRSLLGPVEATGLLADKTALIIVPHAELHYLPFAALLEDGPAGSFLVQRYELSVTPSASVWLALGQRRDPQAEGALAAFAPRPEQLPGSRHEVETVARLTRGSARVFVGATATEDAFRREAPTRRVLHLATYGVLNKHNPLFSYVELAPDGDDDGRLEVHEIFGLSLAADLVVLSACQSGLGSGSLADVPTGDDWVGLTRAFLQAGAARVVATLWSVEDWPTAWLMERFYRGYGAGMDPVRALAEAQREALASPVTSDPLAWAGFIVVGGAGAQRVPDVRSAQVTEDHAHDH